MANRPVNIRLSVQDADKVKRALQELGPAGEQALAKIEAAARKSSAASSDFAKATTAASRQAEGALASFGARVPVIGGALTALGPAGTIAAAGIAAVGAAFAAVVSAGAENQKQLATIEAQLKATGYASGQTVDGIDAMTDALAENTLQTGQAVKQAAGELLTFRNVSGEAFGRALKLSADLAAVGGGDISSWAHTIGRALQEPAEGFARLARQGIVFTKYQKLAIETMVAVGDRAGALDAILRKLDDTVGGAGKAQASGLTGAIHGLKESFGNWLEDLDKATGLSERLAVAVRAVTAEFKSQSAQLTPQGRYDVAIATLAAQQGRRAEFEQVAGTAAPGTSARRRAQQNLEAFDKQGTLGMAQAEVDAAAEALDIAERRKQIDEERAALGAKIADQQRESEENAKRERDLQDLIKDLLEQKEEIEAKRNASVEKYIDGLEDAARAEGLSTTEKKVQLALQEAQNKLVNEYGTKLRDLTDAERERVRIAVEHKDQIEAQREATKKFADEVQRQTDRIADNLSRALGDQFFAALTGKAGNFWQAFRDMGLRAISNLAAETVTNALFRPLIQQFVGGNAAMLGIPSVAQFAQAQQTGGSATALSASGGPILGAIGAGGAGSIGSFGGGLLGGASAAIGLGNVLFNGASWFGGNIGLSQTIGQGFQDLFGFGGADVAGAAQQFTSPFNAIGSFAANFLLDKIMGSGGIGSQIGSTIGGIAGSFIPIPGGTIIGSVLGNLIGRLFGGKKSVGPVGGGGLDMIGGQFVTSGAGDNGFNPAGIVGFLDTIPGALGELLKRLGPNAALGMFPNVGSNGQWSVGGAPSGGARLLDIEQMPGGGPLQAGIGGEIGQRGVTTIALGGSPEDQANAILLGLLKHVDISGVAPEIDAVLKSSVATTLEDLFSDVDFAKQVLGLTETLSPLDQALADIASKFGEMADRASALGLSLDKVNEAKQREIDMAMAQAQAPYLSAAGSIVDFIGALDYGRLSPMEQLTKTQSRFGDLLEKVRGGDVSSTSQLLATANQMLGLGAAQYGTATLDFTGLEAMMRSSLLSLADTLSSDAFFNKQIEATRQQTAVLNGTLIEIRDQIDSLRREIIVLQQKAA